MTMNEKRRTLARQHGNILSKDPLERLRVRCSVILRYTIHQFTVNHGKR